MATITMYDSTTAADIPAGAAAVAGYVDGPYRWSTADWDRFATRRRVRIATRATTLDADAADVERGDLTPEQAPGWVRSCRPAPGRLPLVYVNRSNRGAVEAACQGLRYWLWVATLDGRAVMQPGAIATQWAGQTSGSSGHFDLSLVDEAYFGAAAAPVDGAGEGSMLLRIPGPAPGTFHLFGVSHGALVRVSSLSGGLGGIEQWLSQPGNGWVDHGAPANTTLVPGSLGGGRGLDGKGADRVEVHGLGANGRIYSIGLNDLGQVVLPWEPLNGPALDQVAGQPGPPGPDARPAVAAALAAAVDQLRKAS